MTKFLDPSFQSRPSSQKYRDNWDATFRKKRTGHRFECRDKYNEGFASDADCNDFCTCAKCGKVRIECRGDK